MKSSIVMKLPILRICESPFWFLFVAYKEKLQDTSTIQKSVPELE